MPVFLSPLFFSECNIESSMRKEAHNQSKISRNADRWRHEISMKTEIRRRLQNRIKIRGAFPRIPIDDSQVRSQTLLMDAED